MGCSTNTKSNLVNTNLGIEQRHVLSHTLVLVHQVWISMLIAFYVTLVEKTLQGSGLGGTCRPVSKDGTVTVMAKDPNVQVG